MDVFELVVAYVFAGLFGICIGSFLNVVIYRVPNGMSVAFPGSHCPKCGYQLKWYDNIPVLSYLMLGGKCRGCKGRISPRYATVELANMLLWLLSVALFWERSIVFACITAFASSLMICVFYIDIDHKLVFDRFVIMIGVLGIVAIFFDPSYAWYSHLIGGVAGFVTFYLIAWGFEKLRGIEGLGGGDIKLTAVCGLLLGWERLLLSVLIAAVSASVVLVILSKRAERKSGDGAEIEYPFAPFLTSGFAIAMFFGDTIINWYLALIGLN